MYNVTQKILALLMLMGLSMTAIADDIDIISQSVPVNANVLFVMDLSGSMGWDAAGNKPPLLVGPSRLSELQGAFQDIIKDPDFNDINIGLSVFSGSPQNGRGAGLAHGIAYPVSPVIGKTPQAVLNENHSKESHPIFVAGNSYMPKADTTQNTKEYLRLLSSKSSIWAAGGSTPLVDALYEAALYFKGDDVHWGKYTPNDIRAAHPSTYTGTFKKTSVPIVCTSSNRVSCSKGSCGVTEVCKKVNERRSFKTDTGNNCKKDIKKNNRCTVGSKNTTCGLGTNCVEKTSSRKHNRTCESSHKTIASCKATHPTWQSCQIKTSQSCTTDSEGVKACVPSGTRIKCKEEISTTRTTCDDVDTTTYMCDVSVEKCTRCPGPSNKVTKNLIYKTPINERCPANGIVLLSDGEPTVNTSADLIASLIPSAYANGCNAGGDDRRCGPELASYLASEDQNSGVDGDQPVRTFTVGLALGGTLEGIAAAAYMKAIASAGNGDFVNANNRAELAVAFKQAILGIAKRERTFSAPTYTVNTSTQLTHGKYVYVPMFDRGIGVAWSGNLKRYELKNGKLYGSKDGASVEATDAQGLLNADVLDLWQSGPSTNSGTITGGGAANKIPTPASRKIYTDVGVNGSNVPLGASHELKASNSAITNTMLGATTALNRHRYIKYIRGEKSDGTARHHMGDIIHSKPLQLSYAANKSVLFVGTNEGYLHAIDADSGIELFAFMPSELLGNIKLQYENAPSSHHVYGVDGPMKLWLDDKDKNGIKDKGEDAYLYFGLRRGGGSYYALKLNDNMKGAPTLAWKVDSSDSKFSKLGYTWSEPTFAKLKYEKDGSGNANSKPKKLKPVLVFGGGYVDDHNKKTAKGNKASQVFIVDAKTGKHIWSSSPVGFAVPAKIRTVDADRNGSIDRLYFGDTGGNVWRVDLGGKGSKRLDLSKSKLTHLAKLGDGSGTNGANDRKFFTEPDVAFLKQNGKYALTIAIGSGSRPDPLNITVKNYFFVIQDENVFKRPLKTSKLIKLKDLADAPVKNIISANKKGWKMALKARGEKNLSSALTFQNKVLYTSLVIKKVTVTTFSNNDCSLNSNTQARLYALDLLTGDAVLKLDSNTKKATDSYVNVTGGEILETPQIIYGDFVNDKGKDCTPSSCARTYTINVGKGPSKAGSSTFTARPIPAGRTLPRAYWLDEK